MLSKLAKQDLEELRAGGCTPTDAQIIQLNDLALKIEQGQETTPANMPRLGFAGNVVLHEPTIASIEWWENYGRNAAFTSDGRIMTYFFCLAHARDAQYLCSLQTPKEIRAAVKQWKKTVDATDSELWRALMWVQFKQQDVEEDLKQYENDVLADDDKMDKLWSILIMTAGATGIAPNDLKTSTRSELVGTLIQSCLHARIPMKHSVAKDYIAYRKLLKEIENTKKVDDGQQT